MYKICSVLILFFFILIGCTLSPKYKISSEWDQSKLGTVNLYNADSRFFSLSIERPFIYIDGVFAGYLGGSQKLSIEAMSGKHVFTVKESVFLHQLMNQE